MTGGTVVVLGPVGANFGAGMTGGRAYLYDPSGRHTAGARRAAASAAVRLAGAVDEREPTARPGSPSCRASSRRSAPPARRWPARLLDDGDLAAHVWLVEPIAVDHGRRGRRSGRRVEPRRPAPSQPDRNPVVPGPLPTLAEPVAYPSSHHGAASPR